MKDTSLNKYNEWIRIWQAKIDQLRVANNGQRNRLAIAISKDINVSYLAEAEYFNQKFMEIDQVIALMRHDVATLSFINPENLTIAEDKAFEHFNSDLKHYENEFHLLEQMFFQYLVKLD